jgi:hypothetical protein
MDLREHAFALISVVLGLALTQLLSNLNDLIAARRHVRWYPLPLIWSVTAVGTVINYWWGMYLGITSALPADAGVFLLHLVLPILLFLVCSATLPKVATVESQRDLRLYYYSEARYTFGLWLAVGAVTTVWIAVVMGEWSWNQPMIARTAMVLLVLPLLFTRAPWYHWFAAVAALAVVCWRLFGQMIR